MRHFKLALRPMCLLTLVAAVLLTGNPAMADGADTCAGPIPDIAPLPFQDNGDTRGATNFITNGGMGLPYPYDGEDHVYQVTLYTGNAVDFVLDLAGSTGDLALFLLTDCDDPTSLVAHSEDWIGPGAGPEQILYSEWGEYAPGTYYLWIDSYYAVGHPASAGTYTLSVTGVLPEPAALSLLVVGGLVLLRRR